MPNRSNAKFNLNTQILQVYLYYRVALSAILVAMFISGIVDNVLGASSNQLYFWGSFGYFSLSILSILTFPISSLARSKARLSFLLFCDIGALLVLIHASGGVASGIGYLLIINIAIVSIFVRGQLTFAYTALVSIAVMADTIYLSFDSANFTRNVFASGTLGILLFATSIILYYLTERLKKSSAEAEEQLKHIKNLQEIAQNIVTRMQTGVIVVDNELQIELINTSAKQMLDIPPDIMLYGSCLADFRELAPLLKDWESILKSRSSTILNLLNGIEVRVSVANLVTGDIPKNIFYLEDYVAIKQQAQQLKLASLGRLAASIAHEIRNPLGAMSHAAQLLQESPTIETSDFRLTEIVLNNSSRVNDIVENTLAMSRRKEPQLELIDLSIWLQSFIEEYATPVDAHVSLTVLNTQLLTKFDPTHLRQILTNLITNGLHYSKQHTGEARVTVATGLMSNDDKVFVEVYDSGTGVPVENLQNIFDPFFTTNEKGSGLGLYICKELSEINHASLHYRRTPNKQTCFRIDFSHYQRMR